MLPEPVELNSALANLLKMLRNLLGEQIKLEFVKDSPDIWIEADVGMLDQLVMNLCVNARDAVPGGGALTARTPWRTWPGAWSSRMPPPVPAVLPGSRSVTRAAACRRK